MSRTITTNYPNGLTLTNASDNPISIASGASVTDTTGSALQSTSSIYWSLTNSGTVQANGTAAGSGIAFAAGAALTNTSGGIVSGYAFGVSVAGAGSVVNTGRISSGKTTGSGFTYNQTIHSFSALSAGLFLAGGEVANNTGGTISGYFEGAVIGGGGSVVNAGSIIGTGSAQGLGIVLPSGGSVTNLSGGLISGDAYAMVSLGGGYVDNQGGATLTSSTLGIFALYKAETVTNQGAINGTKVAGVDLLGGGAVQNAAGASIAGGYYGITISGSPGVVTNQGLIKGTAVVPAGSSYYEKAFPFSGVLMPAGGSVRNSTGATISGGSYGVRVAAVYGAVNNSGVIFSSRTFGGAGVDLAGGGAALNNAGGIIAAKWIGVQIGQAGTNTGGTFVNYGTVFASDGTNGAAVWIHGPGEIVNNAGGTIAGGSYAGIANGPFGIVSYYQTTVINRGSIGGTAFAFDSAGTSAVGNRIEIAPGSSFGGTVEGAASSTLASLATLELLSGASTGTVSGFGSQYQNFGNIALDTGAQWNLGGTVAAGTTIAFAAGGTGSLTIATPASMSGTITGFGQAETLTLAGITATGSSYANGVLTLNEASGSIALNLPGSFTTSQFTVTNGSAGAEITVNASGLLGGLNVNQQLELIYIAYFNRAADGPGFNYWLGQNVSAQDSGQNVTTAVSNIANAFAPQPETIALYPFLGMSNVDLSTSAGQAALNNFVDTVYNNLFDRAADAPGAAYWVGQLTSGAVGLGAAALAIANGATAADAIEVQNKIAVAMDFTSRTAAAGLGETSPLASSFLAAAKNVLTGVDGTSLSDASVTAGESKTTAFINGSPAGETIPVVTGAQMASAISSSADTNVITVTGSNQLIDPGAGSHTIQFIAGFSADTLMLPTAGVDQVSGFDPGPDVLDFRSLLGAAGINLNGDVAALGNFVTITDQGADALVNFDPAGHGGGSTVAVLKGLGSVVTGLDTLVARDAIRLT